VTLVFFQNTLWTHISVSLSLQFLAALFTVRLSLFDKAACTETVVKPLRNETQFLAAFLAVSGLLCHSKIVYYLSLPLFFSLWPLISFNQPHCAAASFDALFFSGKHSEPIWGSESKKRNEEAGGDEERLNDTLKPIDPSCAFDSFFHQGGLKNDKNYVKNGFYIMRTLGAYCRNVRMHVGEQPAQYIIGQPSSRLRERVCQAADSGQSNRHGLKSSR
jgi:hypothetical protein